MTVVSYGPQASLLRCASPHEAFAVAAQLRLTLRGADVTVAFSEVLVASSGSQSHARLLQILNSTHSGATPYRTTADSCSESRRVHNLPIVYDGPDLAGVAAAKCMSEGQVCALHAAGTYQVLAVGFQPGFAYLGPLPKALHLPRRSDPRARVPAGSVAIANTHTAVYPNLSPGGWHLLGRAVPIPRAMRLDDDVGIEVGDRVRFVRPLP